MSCTRAVRPAWLLFALSALACGGSSLTAPGTGTLQITSATSGSELDPDGYTVQVDAGAAQTIGLTGSVQLTDVTPGNHGVQLAGIASNCTVAGDNPRSVSVAAGQTATVAFVVTCAASPANAGNLRVTTATTGANLDPDGYAFAADGGQAQPVGVNATVTLANIAGGVHAVLLSGLAANCTVQGANPQSITVTAGATADANFAISCSATGGAASKLVFVSDRDGSRNHLFTVNADGTGLTELSQPASDNHSPAWAPDGRKIVFVAGPHIALMNADGSGVHDLTTGPGDETPLWSPAGGKIMFLRELASGTDEIYVMNADGSGQVNVTNHPQGYFGLAWSPAGDKIGFTATGSWEIFVANPDGSGLTKLADGLGPVWSPDGRRIAFVRIVNLVSDIWSMNADGSDQRQLTHTVLPSGVSEGGAGAPAWSPDGQSIAFHSGAASSSSSFPDRLDLYVMNADGSHQTALAADPNQAEGSPRWSPDGGKIAFQLRNCCSGQFDPDVVVINADGTGPVNLTQNPAADYEFAWKP